MASFKYTALKDPSQNCRFLIRKPELLTETPWHEDVAALVATSSNSQPKNLTSSGTLSAYLLEVPISVASSRGYHALSYCWGSDNRCRQISLNGDAPLGITEELENAIVHIDEPVLWIDQISIDQENLQEKSAQIPLMSRIYSEATMVIVWLGLESEDSAVAMEYMNEAMAKYLVVRRHYLENAIEPSRDTAALEFVVEQELDANELTADKIRAILRLFKRPWFSRVWTLQERLLAKHVHVLCGKHSSEDIALSMGAMMMSRVSAILREKKRAIPGISGPGVGELDLFEPGSRADEYVRLLYMSTIVPLPEAIHLVNFGPERQEATDARDRIYALLSLASDANRIVIVPDYAASCEKVFCDAAKRIIFNGGFVDYLTYVNGKPQDPQMPSWAYDARVQNRVLLGFLLNANCPFNASGNQKQQNYEIHDIESGQDLKRLRLCGAIVDSIAELEDYAVLADPDIAFLEVIALVTVVARFYHRVEPKLKKLYKSSKRAAEAIWRTPIQDAYASFGGTTERASEAAHVGWMEIYQIAEEIAEPYKKSGSTQAKDQESAETEHIKSVDGELSAGPTRLPSPPQDNTTSTDTHGYQEPIEALSTEAQKAEFLWGVAQSHCYMLYMILSQQVSGDIDGAISKLPKASTIEQQEWVYTIAQLGSKLRKPFITEKGYIGMAPARAEPGDMIVIFLGGKLPYVIRPVTGTTGHFELIGSCYCDGIMDGEYFDQAEIEKVEITLV